VTLIPSLAADDAFAALPGMAFIAGLRTLGTFAATPGVNNGLCLAASRAPRTVLGPVVTFIPSLAAPLASIAVLRPVMTFVLRLTTLGAFATNPGVGFVASLLTL